MGSAAVPARDGEGDAAPAAATTSSGNGGGPRWAVGERTAPLSCRAAVLTRVGAMEPHPLGRTLGGAQFGLPPGVDAHNITSNEQRDSPALQLEEKHEGAAAAELMVLGDGDLDPLGVLSSGQSVPNSSKQRAGGSLAGDKKAAAADQSADVKALLEDAPLTVKQQWKAHTDRVMAKYADHTFKIQAVSALALQDSWWR